MEAILTIRLQRKLKASLKKSGVKYDQIYVNGEYIYAQYPEKRNYLFTVCIGDKKIPVCWNTDNGWSKGTHLPPTVDPRNIAKQRFAQLIRGAFR